MGTALLQVSDLVKSFRSPDGDSMTIVDTTRFALNADEQVAVRRGERFGQPFRSSAGPHPRRQSKAGDPRRVPRVAADWQVSVRREPQAKPTLARPAKRGQHARDLARLAGLEPATLGLEGIPSVMSRRLSFGAIAPRGEAVFGNIRPHSRCAEPKAITDRGSGFRKPARRLLGHIDA